jgi:hypothetical protein
VLFELLLHVSLCVCVLKHKHLKECAPHRVPYGVYLHVVICTVIGRPSCRVLPDLTREREGGSRGAFASDVKLELLFFLLSVCLSFFSVSLLPSEDSEKEQEEE